MKYFSIDRFEGNFAICVDEYEKVKKIEIKKLPKNIKEGDIVKVLKDGTFKIDKEKTKQEREDIFNLQEDLFSDD